MEDLRKNMTTKATLEQLPRTRREAQRLGATQFFTGVPCIHGHTTKRNAASGSCCDCFAIYMREYTRKKTPAYKKAQAITADVEEIKKLTGKVLADLVELAELATHRRANSTTKV
jgi:hypothetical protein